jgi:hypothetical protein
VTRTVLRSVLVTTAVAVLMAGCGTPEAGSAATVAGRRIPVSDVQSATTDIQALYGPDQPVPQRSVVYLLAAAPYIQQVATRFRAGASTDDALAVFSGKVAHPSTAALTVIQANTSVSRISDLGQQQSVQALTEVNADLKRDGFTVNPRYGTFDPTRGSIGLETQDWITETATPTPTPSQ